jgi:hypothetical protein
MEGTHYSSMTDPMTMLTMRAFIGAFDLGWPGLALFSWRL